MIRAHRLVSSRAISHHLKLVRSFTSSRAALEAQLLDMPAMSPTMEEGGIVEWKVKPGDKFSAGDVLLDIETDKAEISVEATDDGVLAKLLSENGDKGIPVGKPIAVLAEEGDDIGSIDVDALLAAKGGAGAGSGASAAPEAPKEEPAPQQSSAPASEAPEPVSEPVSHGNHGTEPLPAALRLLHENHIDASSIKGSGPFGRITKGDVLAYLGKIPKEYPVSEQSRINKRTKLDLSNVKAAAPQPSADPAAEGDAAHAEAKSEEPKPQPIISVASIPITSETVAKIHGAKQKALRLALLSLKPKPSVLRNPIFDSLTASTKPPFVVKDTEIIVIRGKPISLEVVVEEPPASKAGQAVAVYFEALKAELGVVEEEYDA